MVKSTVPNHLFIDYSLDLAEWILKDYDINKNQRYSIDEEIKNKIVNNSYDDKKVREAFKSLINNNKNRFIEESNTYSYYKIKYGNIKKIDKSIIDLAIDYLKNKFENQKCIKC
jgi:hypothetical protein